MNVQQWALSRVKVSGINPESRSSPENIAELAASIREHGQLEPIVVTKDGMIVNGHRRYAAIQSLGLPSIWVNICNGTTPDLFVLLDKHSKRLTGKDWLEIHLNGGSTSTRTSQRIAALEGIGGVALLVLVQKADLSPTIKDTIIKVCRYIGLEYKADPSKARPVAHWMIKHRQQRPAIDAIRDGIPPQTLYSNIKNDKPITRKPSQFED